MTQDDMPAPAVVDEEPAIVLKETSVIEYAPPSPPRPEPKPTKLSKPTPRSIAAPDPFAVGVRVLKMAPAWLLFTAVCCSGLVLLLGWVRTGGEVEAGTLPSKRNDARAATKAEADSPASGSVVNTSGSKSTAANDAPAQVLVPAPLPAAPPVQAPQTPPAAPKMDDKARVETPAPAAASGGNFTAQVGSHSDQSEANEQVSRLRAAGFDARSVAAELPGRGTWYRVQVGRFADRGEAAKMVAALRAKGAAASALVVPVQK